MKFTTEKNNPESQSVISERDKKIRKIAIKVIGIALAAATLSGAAGCGSSAKSPDIYGEIDPSIESVTISPDARLRSDPHTTNEYDNNIIHITDEALEINGAGNRVRVHEDSDNGDWYGIPVDSIKSVNPEFNPKGDDDGVIWVNNQRASVVSDTETSRQ